MHRKRIPPPAGATASVHAVDPGALRADPVIVRQHPKTSEPNHREGTRGMKDSVEMVIQHAHGYVVVQLIGVLSMRTVAATRTTLVELLDGPGCVVADLSGLQLRHPGCVAVFAAATSQAGGWPLARLALIGADPRMRHHLSSRGVGPAVPVAESLGAALAMTDEPPHAARTSSTGPAGDRHASRITTIAQTNPEAARFVQGWLGVLLEHDMFGRHELVTTLSTFLEHGRDYTDTSRALGIHPSTARYRVYRITQLTQLDLHDSETLLNLHAATRLFTRTSDEPF